MPSEPPQPLAYDPTNVAFQTNPYPVLAALRDDDPLHLTPAGIQVVSRYEDVAPLLRDSRCAREFPPRLFALSSGTGPTAESIARAIISRDPPAHTRLRRLMAAPFTAPRIRLLRARAARLADDLLDQAEDGRQGRFDLITAVAARLPYMLNCEILGLPVGEHEVLRPWVKAIEHASMPFPPPDAVAASDAAVVEFRCYIEDVFAGRRSAGDDGLLAELARAERRQAGFTRDELIDNAIGLFPAGAETSTNLVGNAVLALIEAPDQLQRVRDDRSLVPAAIEETLRFESPIIAAYRWTTERIETNNGSIRARRIVVLSLAGANRDPRVFARPDRLDIDRDNVDQHLAFGAGRHLCLGAHLARMQAETVLGRLLDRYPEMEVDGRPVRTRSVELRGLDSLPLRVEPATPTSRGR